MVYSEKDISILWALRDFLTRSFKGSSFGPFKMDDAIDLLNRMCDNLEDDGS